jgi:signal transduction histidine kinase
MAAIPSPHQSHMLPRAPRSWGAFLAWVLWSLAVAFLLGFILLFVLVTIAASQTPTLFPPQLANHLRPSISDWVSTPLTLVTVVAFSTLGALIVSRHPRNAVGWQYCAIGLLTIVERFATYYASYTLWARPGSLPGGLAAAWLQNWIWAVLIGLYIVFLPMVFPTGRLLSSRWRPVGWLGVGVVASVALAAAFHPGSLYNHLAPAQIANPVGIGSPSDLATTLAGLPFGLLLLIIPISATSLLLRWRRAHGEERIQVKWFAFVGVILAGLFIVQSLVRYILLISTPTEEALFGITWGLALASLPLATGLAILNYRLYDIDLLINRTLVYGALTAVVVGVYVLVVGALGVLFQASGSILASLLATGIVALLFQPLRDRAQRAVNRLMYGERDEPYAVVTQLSQRLEGTLAPEAVAPTIVDTVAHALKLSSVALALRQEDAFVVVARYGAPREAALTLPLTYQGEAVGQLLLAARTPGEALTADDQRLLEELARHAGLAAQAASLTTALQRAREHLVMTREEERRRLRRDLHDGLGAALTSVAFQLDAACNLLDADPQAVKALLTDVKGQTQTAIADIRRLVYNLRPPILDEWGLVAALREQVAQFQLNGVHVTVEAPESLPALPAAVEVAAYRIALEALANVIRHANASCCEIQLDLTDEAFILTIQDNGAGLPADSQVGVGVSAMRERAAELGGSCVLETRASGGAQVSARLPLAKECERDG